MKSSSNFPVWTILAAVAVFGSAIGGRVARGHIEQRSISNVLPETESRTLVASLDAPAPGSSSAGDMFYRLMEILKDDYVDPKIDDQKLAMGGIKGMVGSLSDPEANFMDKDEFAVYQNMRKGSYSGIGVQLRFRYDEVELKKYRAAREKLVAAYRKAENSDNGEEPTVEEGLYDSNALIPDVVVSAVMPGSPAEKAGLMVGDVIESLDGKWILSARSMRDFEKLSNKIRDGKLPEAEYVKIRQELRDKSKMSIAPGKVRDKLIAGESGSVKLAWRKGGLGNPIMGSIQRGMTKVPALLKSGDSYALRFYPGVESELKNLLNEDLTLDLRNAGAGSTEAMMKCLELMMPTGEYGTIANERNGEKKPFKITGQGLLTKPLKIILGPEQDNTSLIFADALSNLKNVTVTGRDKVGIIQVTTVALQDGSGYTLPVGWYNLSKEVTQSAIAPQPKAATN